jgi:D-amino peptidase
MRVYISVDMEGISGVVHEDQTDPIEPRHAGEYNRFRRLMTDEANAAITGALDAGATSVVVNVATGSCEIFWPKSFILQPSC